MTQKKGASMRRFSPIYPLACLLMALPAASTSAQGGGEATANFTFAAGQHDVGDLITAVGRFLKRNHLVSTQELHAMPDRSIQLQHTIVADAAGAEDVLSQLTAIKGLIMTEVDQERGIYEWISSTGQRRGEILGRASTMSMQDVLSRPRLVMPVQVQVPLEHINPSQAANSLRPFFASLQGGHVSTIHMTPLANHVVIVGLARDVAKSVQMLQSADQPALERSAGEQEERARIWAMLSTLTERVAALEKARNGEAGGKR